MPYYRISWTANNMLRHYAYASLNQHVINLVMHLEQTNHAFDIEYILISKER